MDESTAKDRIQALVAKYQSETDSGKLKRYTEEDVKKGFILPLFGALGWDAEDRNEVSSEEHIKSSGRVDYGFYLNERPKFYLEAKSARANINDEQWAKQAIRYSWNRGVTWAVLTNFEKLIVFNAQDIKSSLGNKRLFSISFTDYISDFDKLKLLSKESLIGDELDHYAEKIGKKYEKVPISSLLYKDLNECRGLLTASLAEWNQELKKKKDLLDEGVQKLLDRLIFIRVAEDRGVEHPMLLPLVRAWASSKTKNEVPLYQTMVAKFRELDKIYNSNLFQEHPFEKWEEYNDATEKAIKILYGKEGYYEYDFKVMPADVLGTVYENYLGHRLSQSKKGITLDKDAGKRKEQGIYYTPAFVVDYIVKHALQPVLDKCKTLDQLLKIKILDPACGSGSFLIKALEVLNEKYKELGQEGDEMTKLLILTSNIYGVDLDEQAVEIARLNLCINSLEGKIKLPLLTDNIKCGNSLISGTDAELKKYFGANFRNKRPFNWEEEFPEVFKQGGFDVVIGNPPYIRVDSLEISDKKFWKESFISSEGKYDLYYLFIEQSIKLLKNTGNLGFIVPNKFCVADSAGKLRELILNSTKDREFFSVSQIDVFKDAANYPVILSFGKGQDGEKTTLKFAKEEEEVILGSNKVQLSNDDIKALGGIIPINVGEQQLEIVLKLLKNSDKLGKYLKISEGLRIPEKLESQQKDGSEIVKQYQFSRYSDVELGTFIKGMDLKQVINKNTGRFKNIHKEKIIIAEDALYISATIDKKNRIPQGGVYFATPLSKSTSLVTILGLLNSKLLSFVYKTLFGGMHMGGGYLRYRSTFLYELPIKQIEDSAEFNKFIKNMLGLNSELNKLEENSNEWESLKSEIEKTDKKIDEEVYKLYGLTPEEVKIVEGSNN